MTAYTDTYSGTYLDTYGVPAGPAFPLSPLDLRFDMLLGGAWTAVPSSLAYQRDGSQPPVTVTRGRPDETSSAVASTAAWELNNRDGRFSPKNPLGPYYGKLGRNTPVRWSVPAQSSYLRLEAGAQDRAFAGDTAGLHVTGSIEVRIALRLSDWQGCVLAARRDGTTPSWYWALNADGTLTWSYWDSGGTQRTASSDAPVPFTSGDMALKVILDATTGTLAFYTAASIDGAYAQLGDAVAMTGGAATTVRAGNCPLVAGYSSSVTPAQLLGRVYELRLYSGIGGTVAADAVLSVRPAGTTSWTDPQGNLWQVAGGAEVSDRDYRFHGQMSSLPPRWDVTGRDMAVRAQAAGPLRLISQGQQPPVTSPLKRAILAQAGSLYPVGYWPMEDASGASFFGPSVGSQPLTWRAGPPTLATDSSLLSSAPLPTLGSAVISANVDTYSGGGTAWTVRFAYKRGTNPGSQARLIEVGTTGAVAQLAVYIDTDGTVSIGGWDAGGTQVISISEVAYPELPGPAYWSLEATPSGGNTLYALVAMAPGAAAAHTETATIAGTAGNVLSYQLNSDGLLTDHVVGHVQVQAAWASLFAIGSPLNAWQGETAAARFARLAGENGWQARILGSPAASAAMGPQGTATLQALLQECEDADRGQASEPRQCLGLAYRTLASMTAQSAVLSLDYSQSQPGGVSGDGGDSGLDPAYDDLLSRNDWQLTRGSASGSQGATVRSQLNDGSTMSVTGLGDYADSKTVNVLADSQLADVAGWMVHAGTADEYRWPVVPVNLARSEMAPLWWQAMQLEVGDYLSMSNPPSMVLYDVVKQLVLGTTEKLGGFYCTMEHCCVPESPYEVIILDDPVYGRLDTDGSVLHATATYPQSTLLVDTTGSFALWSAAASDDPFDIAISGMRLTVTSVTGSSNPLTFTVTPAVNGAQKTLTAGSDVRLWFPPILALA
jgi:hypothetical protein